jgi:hypothetical protein
MAIYEYRAYDVAPGKMSAVHKRVADPGLRLLEKHGFKVVGIWQTSVGVSNQLHEIFEWADLEARASAGQAMNADEEWRRVIEETEPDGPLVVRSEGQIWTLAPFSPAPWSKS